MYILVTPNVLSIECLADLTKALIHECQGIGDNLRPNTTVIPIRLRDQFGQMDEHETFCDSVLPPSCCYEMFIRLPLLFNLLGKFYKCLLSTKTDQMWTVV